jgi:hypothetical protein
LRTLPCSSIYRAFVKGGNGLCCTIRKSTRSVRVDRGAVSPGGRGVRKATTATETVILRKNDSSTQPVFNTERWCDLMGDVLPVATRADTFPRKLGADNSPVRLAARPSSEDARVMSRWVGKRHACEKVSFFKTFSGTQRNKVSQSNDSSLASWSAWSANVVRAEVTREYIVKMGEKRCSHGRAKRNCEDCNPCPHGKVKHACVACKPCPHGKLKHNCADCTGCPHGKRKDSCAVCNPCPHGKRKSHCLQCTPCPHGKLKGNCFQCTPCPHGKLKSRCKVHRLPPREAEKPLRCVHPLPSRQAEGQLHGVQLLPSWQGENRLR